MPIRSLLCMFFGGAFCFLYGETSLQLQPPDWARLDAFQGTLSKGKFKQTLHQVYCPRVSWYQDWIKLNEKEVLIRKKRGQDSWYALSFSDENQTISKNSDLLSADKKNTLNGVRIALDPGHIGGQYSEMEGRHFALNGSFPVKEGDLALSVAVRLKEKLSDLGATVKLIREKNEPVTVLRPNDFADEAEIWVRQRELLLKKMFNAEERAKLVRKRREVLFYRISEIHARAKLVNEVIRPDLVICLHLNAAPWPDPEQFELVKRNDFHVLVNGCFMGGELSDDNQRFEMVFRLVNRWNEAEKEIAEHLSHAFIHKTNLSIFNYKGPNALKVGDVPGVWARNLLANRSYHCPVVFLEPYVANSSDAYERIMLGNYKGKKKMNGEWKESLVEEYADSVLVGIKNSLLPDRK